MRDSRPQEPTKPALESWSISGFKLGILNSADQFSIRYTHNNGPGAKLESDPDQRRLVIRSGSVEVRISDFSISQIYNVNSGTADILFLLKYAPFFGTRNGQGQLSRARRLDQQHARLGQLVNRKVLITFRSRAERDRFGSVHQRHTFPKPTPSNIKLAKFEMFSVEAMQKVQTLLKEWPVPVAFQVSGVLAGPSCDRG